MVVRATATEIAHVDPVERGVGFAVVRGSTRCAPSSCSTASTLPRRRRPASTSERSGVTATLDRLRARPTERCAEAVRRRAATSSRGVPITQHSDSACRRVARALASVMARTTAVSKRSCSSGSHMQSQRSRAPASCRKSSTQRQRARRVPAPQCVFCDAAYAGCVKIALGEQPILEVMAMLVATLDEALVGARRDHVDGAGDDRDRIAFARARNFGRRRRGRLARLHDRALGHLGRHRSLPHVPCEASPATMTFMSAPPSRRKFSRPPQAMPMATQAFARSTRGRRRRRSRRARDPRGARRARRRRRRRARPA